MMLALALGATVAACGGRISGDGEADGDTTESTSSSTSTTETSTSTSDTSTSSTDDGSSTEDDEVGDEVAGFYAGWGPMDFGEGNCDPGLQDCPEGEKCTAYAMMPGYCCVDANKCVEVIGDKKYGDVCTRTEDNDDCAAGLFCWPFGTSGGTGPGVCKQMCDIYDEASCENHGIPDGDCIAHNDGVVPICEVACQPLMQDCVPNMACYWAGGDNAQCDAQGAAQAGEECGYINDCTAGFHCEDTENLEACGFADCCTPYCDPQGDGSECTVPGESCVALGMDIGVCRKP